MSTVTKKNRGGRKTKPSTRVVKTEHAWQQDADLGTCPEWEAFVRRGSKRRHAERLRDQAELFFETVLAPTRPLGELSRAVAPKSGSNWEIAEETAVELLEAVEHGIAGNGDATRCAFACQIAAYGLLPLAQALTPPRWESLLRALRSVIASSRVPSLPVTEPIRQMLAVELPAVVASSLPSEADGEPAAGDVLTELAQGLSGLLDNNGCPLDVPVTAWCEMLASWTRGVRALVRAKLVSKKELKPLRSRFARFTAWCLRVAAPHGESAVPSAEAGPTLQGVDAILGLAVELADEAPLTKQFRLWLRGTPSKRKATRCELAISEEETVASLRGDWEAASPSLWIDARKSRMALAVRAANRCLIDGHWDWQVTMNGEPVLPLSEWQCLFTFSDPDVDMVEFEAKLPEDRVIQRMFLLGKTDQFLVVADAVRGSQAARWRYIAEFETGPALTLHGGDESREAWLRDTKTRGLLLPLAAPEWRAERSSMELVASTQGFTLTQSAHANVLFAPLFLDLHPRRCEEPLTWRRLTVGEMLQPVPEHEAIAYRVQVGHEQWVLYRSFTEVGNRTFLGQNISSEFFCGRFLKDGTTESLIEVELEEDPADTEAAPAVATMARNDW